MRCANLCKRQAAPKPEAFKDECSPCPDFPHPITPVMMTNLGKPGSGGFAYETTVHKGWVRNESITVIAVPSKTQKVAKVLKQAVSVQFVEKASD